jgi:sigma-B regulation protein RsbU (phosphoserine phosphatase)
MQRSALLKEECSARPGYRIAPPAEVCAKLNRQFPMDMDTLQYFTIVYGVLDIHTGHFRYASAGHPGPIHCSPTNALSHVKALNMAIGFSEDASFSEDELFLQPGDRLYFYTDGATEAENLAGEEFSIERLTELLQSSQSQTLEESLHNVYSAVRSWNQDRFKDDLTLCSVQYNGG